MDPHEFSPVYLVISSVLVMDRGMLLHTPEGEGSATPPEPQPTPSTSQPNVSDLKQEALPTETPSRIFHGPQTEAHIEQLLPSPTTYQRKRKTQTRGGDSVERAITTAASLDAAHDSDNIIRTQTTAMPNVDIPQGMDTEGYTSGSGEGRMEHQFKLTGNVPITPYDLPLPGGYTPGSDEGRLKLHELMTMCTKLSKQVLDLEKKKDAQAVEIIRLKKRVKRLERQRNSSTSQPRRRKYRQVESLDDDLEDASKQGRSSDKTEPILLIKQLLEKMLNLQLEAEEESTMIFELIKFIKSMLEE
ncbi:hypothetical protein Tco_1424853, partial [Tanacetum coccineum]